MYQLIAFDMDGTLLGSDKRISPGNRRAVAAAARAGKTVILNTGRCLSELEEYLGLIPEVRYLNCASGALVYDLKEKRTLYSSLLSVETVKQLLKLAALEQAMPHILMEQCIVQKSHCEQMERFGMGVYQDQFNRVTVKWEDIGRMYGENPFPAAKVNIYHTSPQSRDRTEERIRAAGLAVAMARAETTSLELSAPGCDKGVGLEMLCACLKLPMERTIVVGDADNDLEALKKAGLAVAMANAVEAVKAVADVVVADCDHDGCAEAVERYLLRP